MIKVSILLWINIKNINFSNKFHKNGQTYRKKGNFKIFHRVSDIWHGIGCLINSDQVISWMGWYSYEGIHIDDVHIHDNRNNGNTFYFVTG